MSGNEQNSGRNDLDEKTILESWFSLLKHHHQAMQSRRNIQLSVSTAIIGLYLVMLPGVVDLKPAIGWKGGVILSVMYLLIAYLFRQFILKTEEYNKSDRLKYEAIQKMLFDSLNKRELSIVKEGTESKSETHDASWMGIWPTQMVYIFAFFCVVFIW